MCSKVVLHGGELVIFSANHDLSREKREADCMIVTGTHVPEYGKLTSIPISGVQPQRNPDQDTSSSLMWLGCFGCEWVRNPPSWQRLFHGPS